MSDAKQLKRFVIVGNSTGGQGKTLASHVLVYLIRESEPKLRVMCADTTDVAAGREGVASKLGHMVKGTEELGVGPSPSEVQAKPELAMDFWDKMGDSLLDSRSSGILLDVGANVLGNIIDWAEAGHAYRVLKDSIVVDLVVPCVASAKAISDARDVIAKFARGQSFPVGRIFFLENWWQGSFEPFHRDPNYLAALEMVTNSGGRAVKLPLCRSVLLREMERKNLFLGDVAKWSFGELAAHMDLAALKASREHALFEEWLKEVREGFRASGIADRLPAQRVGELGVQGSPV